jgi:hypothetical protein
MPQAIASKSRMSLAGRKEINVGIAGFERGIGRLEEWVCALEAVIVTLEA